MIKRFIFIILGLFLVATPTFAGVNTADLNGYWSLEENGFNYLDETSNNVDFNSNVASSQNTTAKYGTYSQWFNGGSSGVGGSKYVTNTQSWGLDNANFTFNAWVYPNFLTGSYGGNFDAIISQNVLDVWLGVEQDGRIRAHLGGSSKYIDLPAGTLNSNNVWHMITLTWDGTTPKIYVNGTYVTPSGSAGTPSMTGGGQLHVATFNNGQNNNWQGNLDELSAWSATLDAGNITALYNNGYGLFYNSTSGAFDIDPAPTGLNLNLERYYTFDSTNTDEQGNYNANDVSTISYDTGNKKLGSASVLYNAQYEGKEVGQLNTDIHGGTQEFTYNFWVELDAVNTASTYDDWVINDWQGTGGNTDDFLVAVRNGKWAILNKYNGASVLQLDGPSASTNWDMVTIYRNSTHIGISVNDGTPVTQAFTGSINTNAVNRGLGTASAYNLFGNLDEVGMWTRALNSTEIDCLYNSGSGLAYSDFSTCGATPPNTPPTITPIADQIMLEDTRLNVTSAFTIADAEDLPSALTLSYTSSNTSVLNSTGAITFNVNSITGLTDMLQITPNADAFGATNVTIRVTDTGALYNESTFELVVTNVNDAPTISQSIPNVTTTSSLTNQINFTIFDIDSAYPDMSYTLNYVAPLLFSPIASYTPSYTNGTSQHINVTAKNTYGEANVQIRVTDSDGAYADSNVFNYRVNCDSAFLSTLIQSANATDPNNIPCWYQDFSSDIDTDIYVYTWDDFLNSVDSVEIDVYKTTGNQRTLIDSDSSTASSGNFTFNYTATNPSDDLLFLVTMTDTSRNWSVGNSRQFSYSVSQQPDFASQFSVNDGIIYGVLLLFLFFTIGVASQSASLTLIFGLLGLFLANFLVLRLPSYFIWIAGVVVLIILWFMAKLRTD